MPFFYAAGRFRLNGQPATTARGFDKGPRRKTPKARTQVAQGSPTCVSARVKEQSKERVSLAKSDSNCRCEGFHASNEHVPCKSTVLGRCCSTIVSVYIYIYMHLHTHPYVYIFIYLYPSLFRSANYARRAQTEPSGRHCHYLQLIIACVATGPSRLIQCSSAMQLAHVNNWP